MKHSVGDSSYGRAVEAIRVFKEEMIEMEEPDLFNEWIRRFKERLLKAELGGDRKEMWWLVRVHKLGLIHRGLSDVSKVSEEDAKAVSPKNEGHKSSNTHHFIVHFGKVELKLPRSTIIEINRKLPGLHYHLCSKACEASCFKKLPETLISDL